MSKAREKALKRKAKSSTPSLVDSIKSLEVNDISNEINVTGVLTSNPLSVDIKIENFSMSYYGAELIANTTIELNQKRRYGLIGANGTGKSTFLYMLSKRMVPIPMHFDIYFVNEEEAPSEFTALEAVIDQVVQEQKRLEKELEEIDMDNHDADMLVDSLYERLEALDPSTFEKRAGELLYGLGFTKDQMNKKTCDLSGGWRMRVALAKALFVKPAILLLDEPTNHLDLGACVWLEEYLKNYNQILVIISHSQDFLNGVCTNIMHLSQKKLEYYGGNYATYVKTREEREVNQMKHYEKQQAEIDHIKKFIASCGTYANLVKQAKSRQKILDKMEADGLVEKVKKDPVFTFRFPGTRKLPPPVLALDNVSFAYNKTSPLLYKDLNIGFDMDSRVALVGPNGVGKSTLLKLICGDLAPLSGNISRHTHLKIGRYHQHSVEQLNLEQNPIEYMRDKFQEMEISVDNWRQHLGKFGITGPNQTRKIGQLSDGQRSRVVFCEIAIQNPNMLVLDEPTNHLDIECIDSLAEAINAYDGGVILVSHDFRLIDQIAEAVLVCNNKTITRWEGDIRDYKESLKKDMNL